MIIKNVKIDHISDDYKGVAIINARKCFIDDGIDGDIVDIDVYKETSKYFFAKIVNFIEKSEFRNSSSLCEYAKQCGGCTLQHLNIDYYYEVKKNILHNNLKNSGYNFNLDSIEVFKIPIGQRRRINLKYKNGIYGFFEKNSNNIVEISYCKNIVGGINEIIGMFKGLKFTNLDSIDIVDIESAVGINLIFLDEPIISEFEKLKIFRTKKCVINYTYMDKNSFIPILNDLDLNLKLDDFTIKLPNNCFLQATSQSQKFMIDIVKNELKDYKRIADLYCGIGTYSFPLSKNNCRINAFEGDKLMVTNIKENIIRNNVKNIFAAQRDLFNQPLMKNELNEFDGIIINPPRNGAENQCKNICKDGVTVSKVVYISCEIKTLARDLKLFVNRGFVVERIVMIDQFYLSKHIECIVSLVGIVNHL
jgi:23S rRNA (uracil1939-C5)-methyltransferase